MPTILYVSSSPHLFLFRYAGWYPRLFIWDERASGRAKYTVSDVFTDLPDPLSGDQGCVLHEGVGRINIQNRECEREGCWMKRRGDFIRRMDFDCSYIF